MMNTSFTLPNSLDKKTVFAAFFFFLSLSVVTRAIVLGLLIAVCLFVFGLMLDAISELSQHIAQVYTSSDAITRLVIFVLAVLFCKNVLPYAVRLFKGL